MSQETDKLIYHPDVLVVVHAVLKSAGLRGELEDWTHDVCVKGLTVKWGRPDTIVAWQRLTRTIAKRTGISEFRKRKARAKVVVGLAASPDEHASLEDSFRPRWEVADARKAIELLWLLMDEGYLVKDFDVYLDAIHAGVPYREIAREVGMPEEAYSKRIARDRARLLGRLSAVGLALLLAILVPRVLFRPNTVAHHDALSDAGAPIPVQGPDPLPPGVVVDTHHQEEVAALRTQITEAVQAKNWKKCIELYRTLDGIETSTPGDRVKMQCIVGLTEKLVSKGGREAGAPAPNQKK